MAIGILIMLYSASTGAQVTFDWAVINDPDNAPDPRSGNILGSVAYEYRMATAEVTNSQYAEFLNAVAVEDPHGLYSTKMADVAGSLLRNGSSGSFSYTTVVGRADHPVVFVSHFDAMRFTNWLHNGQGQGNTENGVYDISDGLVETRSSGASYFLPSENEWYKAGYYQHSSDGGPRGNFWLYPNSENSEPVPGVDGNFEDAVGDTTPVGSYSANYHGLYDMAGNVWEMNEATSLFGRGVIGGSWDDFTGFMRSNYRAAVLPSVESYDLGFRLASPIPCPASLALLTLCMPALVQRRR
jgi:sulfatase modifying factor 1